METILKTLDDITNNIIKYVLLVVHVHTSNIVEGRSEESIHKYKKLIQKFKDNNRFVIYVALSK